MQLETWAQEELSSVRLGDKRLHPRLFSILDTLARYPNASIPQAFGSWAATKAFYRFCSSDNADPQAIRGAHSRQTLQRILPHRRILAIADTTSFDFTTHPATTGRGPIDAQQSQGFLVHSVLAATDTGLPLGLLKQFVWTRDPQKSGQSKEWRKRPLEEKETLIWTFGLNDLCKDVPPPVAVVYIGDRQGDFFDLFVKPRPPHCALLVRAAYDRGVEQETHRLFATLEQAPLAGRRTLCLTSHNLNRREVPLSVRFAQLTLKPPAYRPDLAAVPLFGVLAQEEDPPHGEEALRWVLLTTCPVTNFEQACQILDWYAFRWLIERYHFVLKSGCRLEALQLASVKRLSVALQIYCIVAWRLLYLTYLARQQPQVSCETFLSKDEWQPLCCMLHKTSLPPTTPPTLREAVRMIAQLGGFLARKGDGEPGVKVLWRGLQRLEDIAQTWRLIKGINSG